MRKKQLIVFGILLAVLCAGVILLFGRTYTLTVGPEYLQGPLPADAEEISVRPVNGEPTAECTAIRVDNGAIKMTFRALRPGRTGFAIFLSGVENLYFRLYVYPPGVIVYDNPFGDCTGDVVIPVAVLLFLAAALWSLLRKYRADRRRSLYRYDNVMSVGLIIFLCFLILYQLPMVFSYRGLLQTVTRVIGSVSIFSAVALPPAFVLSILITGSNVSLMRREGKNWRNMLGTILGVGLCLLTLLPGALGEYLQRSTLVDVHNESGAALYVEIFTESFVSALAAYLECILIGTIVCAVKAARHIPAFDKDYILILGCQIREDGTLTPLLRSRADRAVAFAQMQKEKTGKELVFVPSGGQGPDEVMAEADAIKNYLLSLGIPEERILSENRSVNTYENIRNSMALIREREPGKTPKAAFSTTNYHVFRAGLIAEALGEKLEGVGSPTKRYFWINAFVREFVATLVSERKKHVLMTAVMALLIAAMVVIRYLSVAL